jgi:hypothetical protein
MAGEHNEGPDEPHGYKDAAAACYASCARKRTVRVSIRDPPFICTSEKNTSTHPIEYYNRSNGPAGVKEGWSATRPSGDRIRRVI